MLLTAKCIYLGMREREYNGKVYRDVALEFDGDEVITLPVANGAVVTGIKKYSPIEAMFIWRVFNNGQRLSFAGVADE